MDNINVRWVRGVGELDFTRPKAWLTLGSIGAGKSSVCEFIATKYLDNNGKVFDAFASRDQENLAWLRSDYVKTQGKRVVLLHGADVEVESDHDNINAFKFRLSDLEKGDIFVSSAALYSSFDEEFSAINHMVDVLWKRFYWTVPIAFVCREASNLLFSRVKVGKTQTMAKNETIYLLKEARHNGIAFLGDSQRIMAIDVEIRNLCDYLVIKALGMWGLPKDLTWVYSFFRPAALQSLKPKEFIILSKTGAVGFGTFRMPQFHKLEKENLLTEFGIRLKYFEHEDNVDQKATLISEALQAMPPVPSVSQVRDWIIGNRNQNIPPQTIGQILRGMGFTTIPAKDPVTKLRTTLIKKLA